MAKKIGKENNTFLYILVIINFLILALVGVALIHIGKNVREIKNDQASQMSANNIVYASYKCTAGKSINATYFDNNVELTLSGGQSLLLMHAISGSGVRYTNSDESITFWNKGNTAFVEQGPNNTVTYDNCIQTNSN